MVNVRSRPGSFDSPKAEVGEIDTRAPFQSVKAAVSLFGEVVVSGGRSTPTIRKSKSRLSAENVIDKEAQFLLARREVDKYKESLESADTTKAKAVSELDKAKNTLKDLTTKLQELTDSKQSTIEALESVKEKTKQLEVAKSQKQLGNAAQKQELDETRQQYRITAKELDIAKQELTRIRHDFDTALDAKWAAFQKAAEAQRVANESTEKFNKLSKQIKAMRESYPQLKLVSAQAQEQQSEAEAKKDAHVKACRAAMEEVKRKLESSKKEYDPEQTRYLEMKLAETSAEIEVLQKEMKKVHSLEMEKVKVLTAELDEATKALQEVAQAESHLQNGVASLRQELENVKREQCDLLEKEKEKQSYAYAKDKGHEEFVKRKPKLEQLLLLSETESATTESQEIQKTAKEFRQEAENARLMAEETEKNLELTIRDSEEAKAAKKQAWEKLKAFSEIQNAHGSSGKIKISLEDFNSLKKKVFEPENLADTKKATDALDQVETINASKNDAEKRLEANLKAIEEIKEATEIALRSAEMSMAAQTVVEGELRKWRQEQETIVAN